MWTTLYILAGIVVFAGAGGLLSNLNRRRLYRESLRTWQARNGSTKSASTENGALPPTTAPAWYLLGCALLREGHTKRAARAFGMAHHADCRLESAALLAFACLKAKEGPDSDILEQIGQTWFEMKRPDLRAHWEDRTMLSGLAAHTANENRLSQLGRFALSIVAPPQQRRLHEIISKDEHPNWTKPLLA